MSRVAEHLKILSIFHSIVGGLAVLYFGLITVMTWLFLVVGLHEGSGPPMDPKVQQMAIIFTSAFGGFFLLLGWTYALLTIWSGRCIARRKHRHFSLVMASVNLLAVPFGTALGIFTLIVLRREDAVWNYAGGERMAAAE